jgi:type II secretory pathway pseudopilin PulG
MAFTLLEVLLAIAIAAGMLGVVLFFYTQTAHLRVQIFNETAKTSAARLLLDHLSSELSNARRCDSAQAGLNGGTDSIEFVRLDLPNSAGWTNSPDPALILPASPFRLIRYSAARALGETNSSGLVRTEEPLQNRILEPAGDGDLPVTNAVAMRRNPVSIDQCQFVRFRFWNGTAWLDSWTDPELPIGVEVNLGAEPLPEETSRDDYPYELFRRIIFLPGHSRETAAEGLSAPIKEDSP